MAYDVPGYKPPKKKKLPLVGAFPRAVGAVPLPPVMQNAVSAAPQPNAIDWRNMLASDPDYQQGLADLAAGGISDRANTLAGLRKALIRYGGKGLSGLAGKLGAGWEDLLDPATLAAAAAGDQGGTSVASQLAKAHAQRNLAIQDVLAAKGMLSSGQTGYELGEERQRHTIEENDAINALLDFLSGLTGGFAGRESERNIAKGALGREARDRLLELGYEPTAPKALPPFAPIFAPRPRPRRPVRPPGFREQ